MVYSATGIPVVVKYDAAGRPTGFKESSEINVSAISVSSVSATVIYGGVYTGPEGDPTFTISNLSAIGDVVIPSGGLANDQVLRWDSATQTWYPSDAIETVPVEESSFFSGLTDTPSYYFNGRFLESTTNSIKYSDYGYLDVDFLSGTIDTLRLQDLSTVTISSPLENQFLRYVGGEWINESVSLSNTADTLEINVRNESGATINRGTVVYVDGVHGTSAKKLTIKVASTATTRIEEKLIGILGETLANNAEGSMVIYGEVDAFNTATSAIATGYEGSALYLNPSAAGTLTTDIPTKPNPTVVVGILLRRDSSNGVVYTRVIRTGVIDTLYNVDTSGKQAGDALVYNGSLFGVSAHAISGLTDTTISSTANNQSLVWNGSKWVNRILNFGNLADVDIVGAANGDTVQYSTTTSSWEAVTPVTTVPLEGDEGKLVIISNGGTLYYYSPDMVWDYGATQLTIGGDVVATSFSGDGTNLTNITAEWDGSLIGNATISGNLSVTGSYSSTGDIDIDGTLTATSKSFLIDHPTKEGMKLQYTCLEGPENGVYVRGRCKTNVIVLPDYWVGLVDEDSISVNITPAGKPQSDLFVENIVDNKIFLQRPSNESIDCFYTVYATRKDIEKLIVEF